MLTNKRIIYTNLTYDKAGLTYGYTKSTHIYGNNPEGWFDVTETNNACQPI